MGTLTERYSNFVLRRHKLIVVGTILLFIAIALGLGRLELTSDLRVNFSKENPQLMAFNALEETFDKQEALLLLVVAKDGNIFKADSLELVKQLTEKSWELPYSLRISSLTNFIHTQADADALQSDYLVNDQFDYRPSSIDEVRSIALNEPEVVNHLVSPAGDAALVQVNVHMPTGDLQAPSVVMDAARDMIDALNADYPGHDLHLSGTVAISGAFELAVERDMSTYMGLSYIIILIVLYVMLRTVSGTLITLLIVGISVITAFGLSGWANKVLTPSIGLVPTIIMTIAVADVIHILASYYHQLNAGLEKFSAIKEALRVNVLPVFLTSLATVLGFLTLNYSESPPFRDLGNIVVTGVVTAYVLSMCFLPALLAWLPPAKNFRGLVLTAAMQWLAEKVIAHHKALLIVGGIVTVTLAYFAPQNTMTEDWNDQFDDTFEIRHAIDTLNEKMGVSHYMHYLLDSGQPGGIADPEFLRQVDAFADWFEQQPEVTYVDSLTRLIKRINMNMHGDEPEKRVLPDDQDLIAQYLLLYELTLPLGAGLDSMISMDRSATRFVAATVKLDSQRLIALEQRSQAWLAANAPAIQMTEASGIDMIIAHAQQRNIESSVKTALIALLLISVLLVFTLRSFKLGMISLIPNLAPAVITYGIWALVVGEINMAGAMVATMTLGIVVDDTVHFMTKYLAARREKNMQPEEAIRYTFSSVGVAIMMTSLILIAGFAVTAGSHFQPTVYAGALMAMTLTFALVIDLLLLPALLLLIDKKGTGADERIAKT